MPCRLKYTYMIQIKCVLTFRIIKVMDALIIITVQYVNIINPDNVRVRVELIELERPKVVRNDGKN